MDPDITIQQHDDPHNKLAGHVRQQLIKFDEQHVGKYPFKTLTLLAHNAEEQIVGGLIGEVSWGWLHVNTLWVAEAYRHAHLGSRLMERAEDEAIKMGINQAFLETTDFQAAGFYEKRGYHIFAQLEDFPPGHTFYYLKNTDLGRKPA